MRKTEQNELTKTSVYRVYDAKYTGEKGITLVSLVITIIVLLVLAGVAINMAINSDGLFAKANEATEEWNTAVGQEETTINNLIDTLEEFSPSLKPMVTKWNIVAGNTIGMCLYLPFTDDFDEAGNPIEKELSNNTDVTIDWGDGTVEHYTSDNLTYNGELGIVEHTYEVANSNITITIDGRCNTIFVPGINQLTAIEQWGYTETANYLFPGCTNLSSIASPEKYTFKNVTSLSWGEGYRVVPISIFFDCTSLTSIPDNMFANCTSVKSFKSAFEGCTNLQRIPENLFENTPNAISFERTFYDCTSLTGNAIPLWERVEDGANNDYKGVPNGEGCYSGCTGLTGYDDGTIPSCWKRLED